MRIALLLVLGAALPALAQDDAEAPQQQIEVDSRDEEARILFQAGQLAFDEERYQNALDSFQRAYDLTQRAELLFNIGASLERLDRYSEAVGAFHRYLDARPSATNRDAVEQRIRLLEIASSAEDGEQVASASAGPSAGPWVLIGLGAAAAVAGGVVIALVQRDIDEIEDPSGDAPRWSEVADDHDSTVWRSALAYGLIGLGAAAVVAGIVWRVTENTEVSPTASGLRVRGTF